MNKQVKSVFKILLFLSLGCFLVWISIIKIPEEKRGEVLRSIQKADYLFVVISMLMGVAAMYSRALRWKILMEPLGYRPSSKNTLFAVMIGYLGNLAVNRLGEVTRCGVLTKYDNVPFTAAFGTVIAERLIDLLSLILLFFLTVFGEFDRFWGFFQKEIWAVFMDKLRPVLQHELFSYIAIGLMMIFFVALFLFRKKLKVLFGGKSEGLISKFVAGLKSVATIKKPWAFLFHSVFIWFMYYAMVHVCFFALEETKDLGVLAGMAIVTFGSIGVIATPGGIGAYTIIVMLVLGSLFGKPDEVGSAFGWLVWGSQFLLLLLCGLLALILLPLTNNPSRRTKTETSDVSI